MGENRFGLMVVCAGGPPADHAHGLVSPECRPLQIPQRRAGHHARPPRRAERM